MLQMLSWEEKSREAWSPARFRPFRDGSGAAIENPVFAVQPAEKDPVQEFPHGPPLPGRFQERSRPFDRAQHGKQGDRSHHPERHAPKPEPASYRRWRAPAPFHAETSGSQNAG